MKVIFTALHCPLAPLCSDRADGLQDQVGRHLSLVDIAFNFFAVTLEVIHERTLRCHSALHERPCRAKK